VVNRIVCDDPHIKAVRDLSAKWPGTIAKLIEGKANGPAARALAELIELFPNVWK